MIPVPDGYKVWYEYGLTDQAPDGHQFRDWRPRRFIRAHIVDEDKVEVATGIAVCSRADQFVKRIGRDKALGRAVQSLRK